MPKLFRIKGYCIYFWSNEDEPIHVHISKGPPIPHATKIWLTAKGGCVLANNNSRIREKDLNDLQEVIQAQFYSICNKWKSFFAIDEIKFYC